MTAPANQFNKTRIAPTPSGFLHLGNILSFAITAALARKTGAKILLRIDDLDRARVNQQYIQDIFDTLNFMGIPWDEGPGNALEFEESYSQHHRIALYKNALKQLAANNRVYACTCSRQQIMNSGGDISSCECLNKHISLETENVNWRLITRNNAGINVKNYDGQITQTQLSPAMHNFIVKKKDGFPAYQLTSVIDDLFYGVGLIVRGEDLWPSTLAQQELACALNENSFSKITFYHHPLLMEQAGKKLSKSAGATSVRFLRQNGKSAQHIYTLIAGMLGYNQTVSTWEQLADVIV